MGLSFLRSGRTWLLVVIFIAILSSGTLILRSYFMNGSITQGLSSSGGPIIGYTMKITALSQENETDVLLLFQDEKSFTVNRYGTNAMENYDCTPLEANQTPTCEGRLQVTLAADETIVYIVTGDSVTYTLAATDEVEVEVTRSELAKRNGEVAAFAIAAIVSGIATLLISFTLPNTKPVIQA